MKKNRTVRLRLYILNKMRKKSKDWLNGNDFALTDILATEDEDNPSRPTNATKYFATKIHEGTRRDANDF